MTDGDRLTIQGLIETRLRNAPLQMIEQRLTRDKNELLNRSFSAALPKNVNSSRNMSVGNSVLRKLKNVVSYHKGWQGCSGSLQHSARRGLPMSIFQMAINATAQIVYKLE